MAATDVDQREEENEAERVVRWRRAELERVGFDPLAAGAIAERLDVDIHIAAGLLHRGCPPEIALKILL